MFNVGGSCGAPSLLIGAVRQRQASAAASTRGCNKHEEEITAAAATSACCPTITLWLTSCSSARLSRRFVTLIICQRKRSAPLPARFIALYRSSSFVRPVIHLQRASDVSSADTRYQQTRHPIMIVPCDRDCEVPHQSLIF